MMRKAQQKRGLARNRSAATVVEFAIIVPILLALIIFLVEASIQLLTGALLQFGLREATRFGATGLAYPVSLKASPPASREAAIAQVIALKGLGLINLSFITVTLTNYSAFNTVGVAGKGASGAGGPNAIVQYKVSYLQKWLFSGPTYPAALATGLPGIRHNLVTVIQNEPFPTN